MSKQTASLHNLYFFFIPFLMYERIKIQLKSEDAKRIVSFFVQPHSAGWLFSVYNYISTDFYFEIVIYMGKVY